MIRLDLCGEVGGGGEEDGEDGEVEFAIEGKKLRMSGRKCCDEMVERR